MGYLNSQLPIIQVLATLIGAILSGLVPNMRVSYHITLLSSIIAFIASLTLLLNLPDEPIYYAIGNWSAPVGIEYKIHYFNQTLVVTANFIIVSFLIGNHTIIQQQIVSNIKSSHQHLIYTIFLLIHTGIVGILATNDLFNLYVFMEIFCLATCALISNSKDKRALIAGINYLIMGSITSTLILISIGVLLGLTGSLNISNINQILSQSPSINPLNIAISFFIVGSLLKIGLFPLNFWLIKVYKYTPSAVLTYLVSITGLAGYYILYRFLLDVVNNNLISQYLFTLIKVFSCTAILTYSIMALITKDIKEIVIYSGAAQVGYIILSLTSDLINNNAKLILFFVTADALMKFSLFTFINIIEVTQSKYAVSLTCLNSLWRTHPLFTTLITINLLSNASLPITIGFINKINLLSTLVKTNQWIIFSVVIIGSLLSVIYNYKLVSTLYITQIDTLTQNFSSGRIKLGLIMITISSVGLLFFYLL